MPAVLRFGSQSLPGQADFALLFDHLPDPVAYLGRDLAVKACNRKFRERFPVVVEEQFIAPLRALLKDKSRARNDAVNLPIVRQPRLSALPGIHRLALEPRVSWLPDGGALIIFRPLGADEHASDQERHAHSLRRIVEAQRRRGLRVHLARRGAARCRRVHRQSRRRSR